MNRILITGNLGYVGPVLVEHLRRTFPHSELIGFDAAYFAQCLSTHAYSPERFLSVQHFGDVRAFPPRLMAGVDAVVCLAAISNDPMGNRFEAVTGDINCNAAIAIAAMAKAASVKHMVFASSCSVYGYAEDGARKETDEVNPLTAYARSKINTEKQLALLADEGFVITALRFATACGWSDRIRLDLVLNDFVAGAIASGTISILSDGTPWRPLIDVRDMARAVEWALQREATEAGSFIAINTGSRQWSFRILELAEAVARIVPGTKISINQNATPDRRSYRVDFSLFERLAPRHQPQISLAQSVRSIHNGLKAFGFHDPGFRDSTLIRLKMLQKHIEEGRLDEQLRWRAP